MPNHIYPPVGICIYCGETKLSAGVRKFSDEHIIPFSFGGNLLLPEACCRRCERTINKQIETPVLSHEWGDFREKRKFPSRNKKNKKRRAPIEVRRVDGVAMSIPSAEYSTPVLLYKFREARILSGLGPSADRFHWTVDVLSDHDEEMEMQRKFPEWDKTHALKARPYPFARFVAKVAYGYAVAEYGLAGFRPLVTDIIRGLSQDYFYTVGGSWDIEPAVSGGDHILEIQIRIMAPSRALIVVNVRFFSKIRMPSYHVVVGEIDLQNPDHARTVERHRRQGKIVEIPSLLTRGQSLADTE